jgi:hypothetical protein
MTERAAGPIFPLICQRRQAPEPSLIRQWVTLKFLWSIFCKVRELLARLPLQILNGPLGQVDVARFDLQRHGHLRVLDHDRVRMAQRISDVAPRSSGSLQSTVFRYR